MTKAIKTKTKQQPSKYKSDEEKRLARNKRVRERRKKQRAEKRAAAGAKNNRRRIPRRAVDLTAAAVAAVPVTTQPAELAILIVKDEVRLYIRGEELSYADYAGQRDLINNAVINIEKLAHALGADVTIHDLRPCE